MRTKNAWLCLAALLLLSAPFALHGMRAGEFLGTDDRAEELIREVRPGYQPWFRPFFEPGEAGERRLFTLQAAIGLAALGYCLVKLRQRNRAGYPHAPEKR